MKTNEASEQRQHRRRWSRFSGLTAREIAEADAMIDALRARPGLRAIRYDEALGEDEWKVRVWRSAGSGKVVEVEIRYAATEKVVAPADAAERLVAA